MDFDALFERHYAPLFRYCLRMTGDPDQADDLAQEAFFRLLDRGVEGEAAGLRVWLFRVATNLVRDGARTRETRRRILAAVPPPENSPGPDREMERQEKIEEVRQALQDLSARDREMLLLRHEGFSHQEIAETVGVAQGSVGTMLARALKRFAGEIQQGTSEEGGHATSG